MNISYIKFLLLLVVYILFNTTVFGQNERVQNLLEELQTASTDSSKVYLNKELGYFYQNVNQSKALDYFNKGLEAAKRSNDSLQIANIHYSMGYTNRLLTELPDALDNYLEALRIYEDLNDTWRLVNTHLSIVNVYMQNNDIQKQAAYLDKAEDLLIKENDSIQLSGFYNNKGVIYDQRNELDSAVVFLKKGLHIANKIKDSSNIASSHSNLGLTYKHLNKNEEALTEFDKALIILKAKDDSYSLGILYNNIASTYTQMKNYELAQDAFNRSISYSEKSGYKQVILENYKNIASMYGDSKSYKNQVEYLTKYHTLKDSLYTVEKENQLTQFENDYVIDKKNLELETKEFDLQKKKAQNTTYIVLFIFSLLTLGLLVVYYKKSKKKNQLLTTKNHLINKQKTVLENTLKNLKATQRQLIQSEKMASLGELTAGIAHEIQNPLNFVNNFSEVSNELVDEMHEELDKGDYDEAKAISVDIKQNLEKINHHGKRAESIVKGMLQHSRSGAGKMEPTDINKLTDEYFRLAYHGLRAKDKSFNATLETDYDKKLKKVDVIPQDIGRVILNLFTNAFYAVNEKKSKLKSDDYNPTVSLTTEKTKDSVVITVRDNGNGIPKKVLDKIFQPFFTTKPAGKGTGLGLSMSYDIVKAHKGELKVKSEEGKGTVFSFHLPL